MPALRVFFTLSACYERTDAWSAFFLLKIKDATSSDSVAGSQPFPGALVRLDEAHFIDYFRLLSKGQSEDLLQRLGQAISREQTQFIIGQLIKTVAQIIMCISPKN